MPTSLSSVLGVASARCVGRDQTSRSCGGKSVLCSFDILGFGLNIVGLHVCLKLLGFFNIGRKYPSICSCSNFENFLQLQFFALLIAHVLLPLDIIIS